jgi:response regulator RpfG family c-di-GMP phosphodiesterase
LFDLFEFENGSQFDPELVDVFLAAEAEFNGFCESAITQS